MVKKTSADKPEPRHPNRDEMRAAIPRLQKRIAELESIDLNTINKKHDPGLQSIEDKINDKISELFGYGSPNYYKYTAHLDTAAISMVRETSLREIREGYSKGIARSISRLKTVIELFEEKLEEAEISLPPVNSSTPNMKKVFLVHGHDHGLLNEVARFVTSLGIEPIILHEKPNEGLTVIEKFERYADVGFAIVLLTPDDRGGVASTKYEEQKLRARQNVILELGFFIGKLGRMHVCPLYVEEVELPSDYDGVLYVPHDRAGAWKLLLAREMKQAGLDVDLNKAA